MNISLVKLGEEECELCDLHEHHLQEMHNLNAKEMKEVDPTSFKSQLKHFPDCPACASHSKHIDYAKESRELYRQDGVQEKNPNCAIYSGDMQKVLMLPLMPGMKKSIFCQRLLMFNETFAPVGGSKNRKPVGVLCCRGLTKQSMYISSVLR